MFVGCLGGFINVCRVSGGFINVHKVPRRFYIVCISLHTVVAVGGLGHLLLSASCWSGSRQRGWWMSSILFEVCASSVPAWSKVW